MVLDGKYFEQSHGTTIGNLLLAFIVNLFMIKFEINLEKDAKYFPY